MPHYLQSYNISDLPPIQAVPLTPDSFAKFGGVLSADHQAETAESSSANYGTATKLHDVSPIVNNFEGGTGKATWNIFRCSAPKQLEKSQNGCRRYQGSVLERHPYSTQAFIPMGQPSNEDSYLVIVAESDASTGNKLPIPTTLSAFVCKGNQSVTYGAGTWHAPMVVIGDAAAYIDFAVLIHESGVADDDCQEVKFESGFNIVF
ncbi:hypothetical protein DIURU_002111 [Diutina rugosa]|uniref:Ureidoglycolate lyase n=1 Tax=Diutina rugosa TaxID=5481 RepID=A0A642URC2_DIURU|nr:uncharacterized protein DIURU_002111 [Diutina rugosa]KAA8903889.1 hypothetical protein DIURU_002111 [Diutina rugosa]